MTKTEQTRLWTWRFKVLQRAGESTRNVTRTCRHFGISRQAFYNWKRRYEEFGAAGLYDRPRAPHRSPRATAAAVVSKIVYLRHTYHFGPGKIADYLKRFHQITVATSTVHRILGRHGMNRLPANQKHRPQPERWQRYEKPRPGHPAPARRQVPRADSRHPLAALSVHRHRRLHADSRAEGR